VKNKNLTYFLIAASLGIWGFVFYRIFKSSDSGESNIMPTSKRIAVEKSVPEEKYALIANYPDPFLKHLKRPARISSGIRRPVAPATPKTPPIPIDWSFIDFIGIVKNPIQKKKFYLINLRGHEILVAEGQQIDDVSIIKLFGDSLKVKYQDKFHFYKQKK
jgi:hypothetical protein